MAPDPGRMVAMVRQSGIAIGPALEWLLSCLEPRDLAARQAQS